MKMLIVVREAVCAHPPVELMGACLVNDDEAQAAEEKVRELAEAVGASVFCATPDPLRGMLEYLEEVADEYAEEGYDPIGGGGGHGRSDLPAGMRGED